MGGQPSTSSSGSTSPHIPPNIQKLIHNSSLSWLSGLNAANAAGGLPSLLNPNPEQIAQLTPDELANIQQFQNIAQNGSYGENQAYGLLNGLTSGPIGSSPATQAAMRAYDQNVAPTIASSLGASGGGRGGEMAAAMSQGQTSAYVPLVQQEIANREAAIPQYAGLGQQQSQDIQTALTNSDLIRQIAQAQDTANFNDFMRRSGLIQQFTQGPLQLLGPSAIGSTSQSTTSSGGGGKF